MLIKSDCDFNTDYNVSRYYNNDSDSETDDNVDIDLNKTKYLL